jgi:hypothetical protein
VIRLHPRDTRSGLAGQRLRLAWLAAGAALGAAPLAATTYVMVSDAALVDQADAAAVVTVTEVAPSAVARRPSTDFTVTVERTLAGRPLGGVEVVRVPGGVGPDGVELTLWGAPRFHPGDRALLFLAARTDGTWEPLHLMLGAFHELRAGGRRLAVRELDAASELRITEAGAPEVGAGRDRLRDFDRFADWIAARATGGAPEAAYFVDDPEGRLRPAVEAFTLFEFPDGGNPRWADFDIGLNVGWRIRTAGYPGTAAEAIDRIEEATQAINQDPQTPIDYRYVGITQSTDGFQSFDGVNATIFGDPNGEVPGSFVCGVGGVLAFGGPWTQGTLVAKGRTWKKTIGADIVFNDGVDCILTGNPSLFEETWGHEALHTLGLGHACGDAKSPPCAGNPMLDDALMRALAHDDDRGARLTADDLAGLRSIYEAQGGGGTGPCVPGPMTLCLNQGRFRVEATFRTQQGGATGQAMAKPLGADSGTFTFFSPDNVEVLAKVLDGCPVNDRFWVFAAGLTNVRVDIFVTDTQSGATKTYVNPLGRAYQPVQDTSAFATCP